MLPGGKALSGSRGLKTNPDLGDVNVSKYGVSTCHLTLATSLPVHHVGFSHISLPRGRISGIELQVYSLLFFFATVDTWEVGVSCWEMSQRR